MVGLEATPAHPGYILWVIVMLKREPSLQSEVMCTLEVSFKDLSVFGSNSGKQPHSMMLPSCFPVRTALTVDEQYLVLPDEVLWVQPKEKMFCLLRPDNLFPHAFTVL